MLPFLWLIFNVRLITAELKVIDCRYIDSPVVKRANADNEDTFNNPTPLNVCVSKSGNAFKFSCDNTNQVIVNVWSGAECDGNPINGAHTVKTVDNPNLEPFNCVSKNECDYVYTKFIFYNPPTNCKNPQDIDSQIKAAIITDICIPTHSGGSEIYTSCDLSGTATMSGYTTTDCTGTKELNIEFTSNAHCVINEGVVLTSARTQAICPTDIPTTNNPTTNNPTTNNPTTNNPTTNNPTTNNPTTNNPTTNNPTTN
eukprot:525463_1